MLPLKFRRDAGTVTPPVPERQSGTLPDDARLVAAIERLTKTSGRVDEPALAGTPVGTALDGLNRARSAGLKAERTNLASVAKEASEAAINIGWTTYDIGEVAQSTQTIASAIEEMVASIAEVSDTSESAGACALAAREAMASCTADVRNARAAMDAIRDRTHQIDERLKLLQNAIAEIGTMAGTIATISSQTNLLALNATIEAARAGEAGRGFSVVAAEVKSLSGQTARSTEQIRTWLNTLQGEMGQIAKAVEESRAAVASGSTVVEELGGRVEGAAERISQTSEMNAALAASLGQQRSATSEISGSVQSIAEKAAKTRTEIDSITSRLAKAEALAQKGLEEPVGIDHYELVRLPADIGQWKRALATILVGFSPADQASATLRGRAAKRAAEAAKGGSAPSAAIEAFLTAEAKAHEEAARMVTAIAQGNWDVGTPAYKAATAAMKDMILAAEKIV
ncbi:methyl-accepting chemotaxis protein [Methylorubrum suomiense]|uniref:Chromosome partition protein Smc n=1 Tax=Methylorubrum suomiense TaxID=144191 RepID=A0ABQ4UXY9_9HYPH|nr:methyl-accepting chemotaxis protein [Methylorubrum suomiense]GJE75947.1 Chromosome partition protein Smc [Methylorubrum suomiense]